MSDSEIKSRSGCKTAGCGCLILAALVAVVIALVAFFTLRSVSPGKMQAHHFIPQDSAGTVVMNLHRDDEGLTQLYALLLQEAVEQDTSEIPEWVKSFLPGLSDPANLKGPIGPQIMVSLPPTLSDPPSMPLIAIDLNSYSRAAATALQIAVKTSAGSRANETVYQGISLYEDHQDAVDFAIYKGFLLAAKDLNTLKTAVDAMQASKAAEWPEAAALPDDCDLHADWSGDFSSLAIVGTKILDIAAPEDGDFTQPVSDVTRADLCVDVVSADRLTFMLRGETKSAEAAQRVLLDLQEHARELQTTLKESNLDFQFTAQADDVTAILDGDLSGLEQFIHTALQSLDDPLEEPPETMADSD